MNFIKTNPIFFFFTLGLLILIGIVAGSGGGTPAQLKLLPGEIDIPSPGSAVPTKIIPVVLQDGTRCVIAQNGYRGVGIDCHFFNTEK